MIKDDIVCLITIANIMLIVLSLALIILNRYEKNEIGLFEHEKIVNSVAVVVVKRLIVAKVQLSN
jgi:hypothetical protein